MQELIFIDGQSLGKKSVGHSVFLENILLHLEKITINKFVIGIERGAIPKSLLAKSFTLYKYKSKWKFIRRFLEIPYACFKMGCGTVVTGFVSPFVPRIKRVVIIHDIGYLLHPEYYKLLFIIKIRFLTKLSILFGASVLTVSNFSKLTISKFYKIKLDEILIIPNGVDQNRFTPKKQESDKALLKKYNINKKFILFVGTLQPRKNINGIVDAFNRFSEKNKESLNLIFIGRLGWGVSAAIKKINNDPNILHFNNILDSELPVFYRNADIFVYPSHFEGFGIPIIEAMASGTPVITSDNSCLPEIAGNSAIFVDSKNIQAISDAMLDLVSMEDLKQRMRLKGLSRSKIFDWHISSEKFMSIFI